MTIDTSRFKIPDRKETRAPRPELPFKVFQASRQDRIAQLMQLLNDAVAQGNDDLAQEVRSDLFKEYGLQFNKGGMMDINYMTRPLGYQEGGVADILDPSGRITDTDREFAEQLTGVPERENVDTTAMRSMLESWMYKNPDQRISDSDIANMAIGLARDMAGGSSNENVNMAIDRLNALMPSVKEKVRVENTDLFTRGMQGLYSLLRPSKNRGVGFERVR